MGLTDQIAALEERIKSLENQLGETGYGFQKIVTSEIRRRFKIQPQAETQNGLFTALCVDTQDPWKQNRVRFFSPLFHDPNTPVLSLPFAYPISSMGGFDDSGLSWVPPVGSTLVLGFENSSRSAPFYHGTTWHRDRGPDGNHNWGYNISEYYNIHEGHRNGYLLGPNDGSQVLPQWNTESYNGIDLDSSSDFVADPEAQKKTTYPNIYGFKTPQKHMMKMVDGDYKCNHKNKRMELQSSCGNWIILKDDHLHQFQPSGSDQKCEDSVSCKEGGGGPDLNNPSNSAYFKHQNELRPWNGPGTPQNNNCTLKQTGIQLLSISGHTFGMDDSVTQPNGVPEWERSMMPFDFGCENKYSGKTFWVSATGHRIEMNDEESDTNVRSDNNYIRMVSACGNRVELNDHSRDTKTSGDSRGITLESTSRHIIQLADAEDLEQSSPRREGGVPINKAKQAYVRVRSGYGLEILMQDANSQQKTQQQFIQIFSPQIDNTVRGPHIMRFQEAPSGPGQVMLRVGGDYVILTYDNSMEVVGDVDKNPSDKIVLVSRNTLIDTKEFYLNAADVHAFIAKKVILLMAGQDVRPPDGGECGPNVGPVLVMTGAGVVMSDRVFASASPDAPCVSIFQLLPFHECPQPPNQCNPPTALNSSSS